MTASAGCPVAHGGSAGPPRPLDPNLTLPPGPRGQRFRNLWQRGRNYTGFMRRLHEEYGDIVYFEMPFMKLVVVFDAELIREVLLVQQPAFPPWFPGGLGEILKHGAVALHQGEEHRRRSEFMTEAFSEERVEDYARIIVRRTKPLLDRFRPGSSVNVVSEIERYVWDALVEIIIGEGVEIPRYAGQDVLDFQKFYLIVDLLPGTRLLKRMPFPAFRRGYRSERLLDEAIFGAMKTARAASYSGRDVMAHYTKGLDEGRLSGFLDSEQAVRDEIIILLSAFVDAPTGAIAFGIHHLARHPSVREKLEREVDEVLGDREMEPEDFERLPYARAVVSEILRIDPPAPVLLPKETQEDREVGGYRIPKGTLVHCGLLEMHRTPAHWEEAGEFRPERWLDEPPPPHDPCPAHGYIPFGLGPHACRGTEVARRLVLFALAALARRRRLEPVSGGPPRRNDLAVGVMGKWPVRVHARAGGANS